MNIDERLEKLKERREALARTRELIAADLRDTIAAQKKNEKQIAELVVFIQQLSDVALRNPGGEDAFTRL
jgi:hypothetical protein